MWFYWKKEFWIISYLNFVLRWSLLQLWPGIQIWPRLGLLIWPLLWLQIWLWLWCCQIRFYVRFISFGGISSCIIFLSEYNFLCSSIDDFRSINRCTGHMKSDTMRHRVCVSISLLYYQFLVSDILFFLPLIFPNLNFSH